MLVPSMSHLRITMALLSGTLLFLLSVPAQAGTPVEQVDFERQVMGLFGRMGCSSGSCHGSFQGRGGFRLSLFGYDPEMDYLALTRDALSRRINRVDPDRSLLLLKPTGQIEHGGGRRFVRDSWQYRLLRDWIVAGAHWERGSGAVTALAITPPEYRLQGPGQDGAMIVRALFADGSNEDVTRFCDFRSNDDAVVEVTATGHVKGIRPGDTCIVVSYRGNVRPVRVMVPVAAPPGFQYPTLPEANYIDHEVFAKLRNLNIVPAQLAGDTEFLRRVTIDTIGSLPSPDEVRAFVQDTDPGKRARKIDSLLEHPLHAALWATKFSDITGNNTDALDGPRDMQVKQSQEWQDWFGKRIAENMPYDAIVRGVLCATSRDGRPPEEWIRQVITIDQAAEKGFDTSYPERPSLDLFWRRRGNVPIEQWGEKTAAAFLGIRLECAQCHKHPFDRWTQADYRAYANIFGQVAVGASPEAKKCIAEENAERMKQTNAKKKNQQLNVREVFLTPKARTLPDPDTRKPLPPRALGGPTINAKKGEDARLLLFDWLHAPDNPFFARSFANRVWGHYFGVGIVEPVDNLALANPPSNERLLEALARDFVAHHYDIRHLERTILDSRVYQLAAQTNASNRLDRNNYSHAYVRPMMAEVVLDILNDALGVPEKFGPDAPSGCRALEMGVSRVQNGNLAYAFRIFGRSPRTAACDCQRALDPALPQTLYRMTDQGIIDKLQKCRLQPLLKSDKSDEQALEEIFLAALTRWPTDAEKKAYENYRQGKKDRQAAFTDALWALINTREFILNH
ncbi:MAG TPA: DUF1549 and DUF1553 domain-containing protein [Gemmataceae bacterium]|nr:DUF1549 and DUF1553 domain-containing protein [Gemmataceae bacterium]